MEGSFGRTVFLQVFVGVTGEQETERENVKVEGAIEGQASFTLRWICDAKTFSQTKRLSTNMTFNVNASANVDANANTDATEAVTNIGSGLPGATLQRVAEAFLSINDSINNGNHKSNTLFITAPLILDPRSLSPRSPPDFRLFALLFSFPATHAIAVFSSNEAIIPVALLFSKNHVDTIVRFLHTLTLDSNSSNPSDVVVWDAILSSLGPNLKRVLHKDLQLQSAVISSVHSFSEYAPPIISTSYARVGLMGNPSDGFHGKTISLLIKNFSATVTLIPNASSSDKSITIPHTSLLDPFQFTSLTDLTATCSQDGFYGVHRLLLATVKTFTQYCLSQSETAGAINWTRHRGFSVTCTTTIPRQVGLAGSSAIITAFLSALISHYIEPLNLTTTKEVFSPSHRANLALAAESESLKIAAGLQDRVIQAYGGLMFMDFTDKSTKTGVYTRLPVASVPRGLWIAYIGVPSDSGAFHSDARARYEAGDEVVISAMREMASLAVRARDALAANDTHTLAELMDRNFEIRRLVYGDRVVGARNLAVVNVAREFGYAAKFSGSGGCILGLWKGEVDEDLEKKKEMKRLIRGLGYVYEEVIIGDELFKKGWKQPLTMADLWDVPPEMRADFLVHKFEKEWIKQLAIHNKRMNTNGRQSVVDHVINGSVLRSCLWKIFLAEILPLGLIDVISKMCNVLSPLMQQYIITYVNLKGTDSEWNLSAGVGFALGLFALQLLSTILFNVLEQELQVKAISTKAMITGMIYRKSLKLSPQARQHFNSGKIVNMVSSDSARIQTFMFLGILVFTLPFPIFGSIIFLLVSIGWPALLGLSLIVLALPIQRWIFGKMRIIRACQAPITDKRVKKTTEVLNGIRVIKFFSWEMRFFDVIDEIRSLELIQVLERSIYQAIVMTQAQAIPTLCACVSFITYGALNTLDPAKVFSSMSWFNQLSFPIYFIPGLMNSWAEFNVALSRIESLLMATELEDNFSLSLDFKSKFAIVLENADFDWSGPVFPANTLPPPPPPSNLSGAKKTKEQQSVTSQAGKSESNRSSLKNISVSIAKGSLTAVVGPVGSGKSSLMNALMGELCKLSGSVSISGELSYAAQSPWIQNATIRENILFGSAFDKARYLQVLYDAALLPDLRLLPDRDQTSIGERGITLSGGQKQRISIARLMYNASETVLLDDPLSAVDTHVGHHLFKKCILGSLKDKTRILVTHQLHYLSLCDFIIYMNDGEINEQGDFSSLIASGGGFSKMMKSFGSVENLYECENNQQIESENIELALKELGELTISEINARDIMSKEDRVTGGVKRDVWWRYILACGGIWWIGNYFPWLSFVKYSMIYLALAILNSLTTFLYAYFFAHIGTRASKIMHQKALQRILASPVHFFDTTPIGRIINRFSADIDSLDNSVTTSIRQLASTISQTLATFVVMICTLPVLLAVVIPCTVLYGFIQSVYRSTARELKRLSSVARSPWFNNVGETLVGVTTIRAYREQARFIKTNDDTIDVFNSANYYLTTAGNWLAVRLELIGSVLVFAAAILGVATNVFSPTLFGLCLTYSLTITQTLSTMVQNFTQCEIAMNAAERVEHYAYGIEPERNNGNETPPKNWPSNGAIEFQNVSFKYAPNLVTVLKNASFKVGAKEKIGIVGRTGAGKSSLMQALFRTAELTEGRIIIDGINIEAISLKNLRTRLAIIPQDPVLFSGTFRFNMDPFGDYSDADLWQALDRAGLKAKVNLQEGKLDGNIDTGGENLSVGERQLLCLSRAMLKKPKILIMDEVTANVDYATDSMIQKVLREDFKGSTILTIAHRINTIIDYDKVLVLDNGNIVEYDSPSVLLENEASLFYSLATQNGDKNLST
ncbi:Multidrug resistance-associated protein 1 [Physocladia obscura]|uniref:Multidrug resistance-associated protein 1 n=1 Tax=Physocladia obscura TaxID=109957 RepID=A0AAD5SXW8_9FUNG|nr:Multidrug resistance-associated protein 1 [Physocladia obscura]